MATKSDKICMCAGMCSRCKGWKVFVVGLIFLANFYLMYDWWLLIGALLTISGIVRIIKPGCGHCC